MYNKEVIDGVSCDSGETAEHKGFQQCKNQVFQCRDIVYRTMSRVSQWLTPGSVNADIIATHLFISCSTRLERQITNLLYFMLKFATKLTVHVLSGQRR